jgi:hypothetical protein
MDIETDQTAPGFVIKLEGYSEQMKHYSYWSEIFLLRLNRTYGPTQDSNNKNVDDDDYY